MLLRNQLPPRQDLPYHEQHAERDREVQSERRLAPPRPLQRHAAAEEHQCVDVQQRRQLEMMPIRRAALPHDEGAGECGERHRDRPDADPHPRLCDATAECAVPSPVRHAPDRPARRRWPRRQDRGAHWAAACIT